MSDHQSLPAGPMRAAGTLMHSRANNKQCTLIREHMHFQLCHAHTLRGLVILFAPLLREETS